MSGLLKVKNNSVAVDGKIVVKGVNLKVGGGEVHIIMGPNGSGKTSLALALMGHPAYKVVSGNTFLGSSNLFSLSPNERVKKGLFLSFQNPVAVQGVTLGQLAWSSYKSINGEKKDVREFYSELKGQAQVLGLKEDILERFVNEGFSGGEKKKAEMLLLFGLNPKIAIFDEIDTGVDADSLKIIAKKITELTKKGTGVVLITHQTRILKLIKADFVHILKGGKIIKSGNAKMAKEIEEKGYGKV